MIAPRWPISAERSSSATAASGEWLGRNGRTHSRSGAAALNSSMAQSFQRRVAGRLQVRLGNRQGQRDRTVDDRCPYPVEVHVLQSQLRVADPEPVVLEAGPAHGAEHLELVPWAVRCGRESGRCRPTWDPPLPLRPVGHARPDPSVAGPATAGAAPSADRGGHRRSRCSIRPCCRPLSYSRSPTGPCHPEPIKDPCLGIEWPPTRCPGTLSARVDQVARRPLGDDLPGR